ncbi:MAG: saccharopine dehydrogenase NADP-binding domain-containing protein [Elusimicrobia bacterium]|nr:saccharopine dehydrogenase NADP-binding domain-containing protein [Elusimicrobiota bacterium]
MRYDFVVVGATGQQGLIASRDLLERGYRVLMCGRRAEGLRALLKRRGAGFARVDLRDVAAAARVIGRSGSRIALNCAELRWNLHMMKACLQARSHYLDLGGLHEMTVRQYAQDRPWRARKLLALLGCGSTPGIANVMAARAAEDLDAVEHIDLGFAWESNVKTFVLPYSLESIVHELTVPAVVLEHGRFRKIRGCPLEESGDFLGVGRQVTRCIVHSEVYTFHKYFKDKGLRSVHYKAGFPAHSFKVLETLMQLGFTSGEQVVHRGETMTALEFTGRVLRRLPSPARYAETENLWVKVRGTSGGAPKTVAMDCLVRTTPGWSEAGSNVGTGRTIAVMALMLHRGRIDAVGVTAPEACVPAAPFFRELEQRGMRFYKNRRMLSV